MSTRHFGGVAIGVVSRLDDPAGEGRIQVRFPWMADDVQSHWCRLAATQGGYSRGNFIRPEIGDEVLVVFENGDPNQPWVVGCLWNGQDAPPGPGNPDGKNDHKFFQTRSGHQLIFDDGDDGGSITLHDCKQKLHTKFDVPGRHIETVADTGQISLSAPEGRVRLECARLNVHSTETTTVSVQNKHEIRVRGKRTFEVEEKGYAQKAANRLEITTPDLKIGARVVEAGAGQTALTIGSLTATIEPILILEQVGAVTRKYGSATFRIQHFRTENEGRSGPLTINAPMLDLQPSEALVARAEGAISVQAGLIDLQAAQIAMAGDGGEGKSLTKASLVCLTGGLVNLNPQMFTGPATKAFDVMIGMDAHGALPGIAPVAAAPFPFMPHGFVLPIILDVKSTVLVNNVPMAGSGSTAVGVHMPPTLPLPWSPMPRPGVRQMLAAAALSLFVPAVMSAGMMALGMIQAAFAGQNPVGLLTSMDAQQWRLRLLPSTQSLGSFLAMLTGLAPYPVASGSITLGSPNVTGEDMPFSMLLPFPFANSCSDIPIVPNATVVAASNVMVGVSLTQLLSQAVMALAAYGVTKRLTRSKIMRKIGDPVDIVSGARVEEVDDLELPGPLPLVVTRNALSTAVGIGEGGVLGLGSRLCFERRLTLDTPKGAPKVWTYHTHELRSIPLPFVEEYGAWHFDRAERLEICRADEHLWDIRDEEGITHRFEQWQPREARLVARIDRHGNTITYHYDSVDPRRVTGITDSAGRKLRLEYAGDRLTEIWVDGHPTRWQPQRLRTYRYDDRGRLVATAGPDGHETRYDHDGRDRVIRRHEPSGYVWHWAYDDADRVVCTYGDDLRYYYEFDYQPAAQCTIVEDHAGRKTTYHYDGNRVVDIVLDPEEGVTETYYEDNSLVLEKRGEDVVIERKYDERGRLVEETLPSGGKKRWEYDERGWLVREIGPCGAETRYTYDRRGNPIRIRHPDGGETLRRYDGAGRIVAEIRPDGTEHTYVYDELGDLVEETHDGITERHVHDGLERRIETRDAAGNVTTFEYDRAGRMTARHHPDGTTERWAYDAAGNCVAETLRTGEAWRYAFDGAGRKVRTVTPEGQVLEHRYGLNDKYAAHVDGSGRGFRYGYDRCQRLAVHETDDGVIDRFHHDRSGRLCRTEHGDGAFVKLTPAPHGPPAVLETRDGIRRTTAFDAAGRYLESIEYLPGASPRTETAGGPVPGEWRVAVRRRPDGVVTEEVGPLGAVRYTYAPGTRLTRLQVDGVAIRIRRDARGRPVEVEAPDGVYALAAAGPSTRITTPEGAIVWSGPGGWSVRDRAARPVAAYAATHDEFGCCVREDFRHAAGTGYVHRHRYDRDLRLAEDYDASGNRLLPGFRYGPGHRLLEDPCGPVEYDRRGRVVARHTPGGVQRFWWDDLNRLREAELEDGTVVYYRYDSFDRLVERVEDPVAGEPRRWQFLWAGDNLAGENRPDGTRVRYFRFAHEPTPWAAWVDGPDGRGLHLLHADVRGAVVAATTAAGDLSWWADYTPYGECTAHERGFDQRLRLPGQWSDPVTGLHYNRFRWYVPEWGRYLTPDPLGVQGGLNRYAYAAGDPLQYVTAQRERWPGVQAA